MSKAQKFMTELMDEWLMSKGFDPDDAPYEIKDEWKDFPICKAMLEKIKVDVNGELQSVEKIEKVNDEYVIVIPVSSIERRLRRND